MLTMRTGYSRAEDISDATIHVLGVAAALIGVLALIPLSLRWSGEPTVIFGTMVYAVCLLTMLLASAIYHMTPHDEWRAFLQKLDQSAIYIKIAGTYTPFAILSGAPILMLMSVLWAGALGGIVLKMLAPDRFIPFALGLYLAMGWSGIAADGFLSALRPEALNLMMLSGAIYTSGVVFFLWERLPFHKTIWHGMVLIGTCLLYAALVTELAAARTN